MGKHERWAIAKKFKISQSLVSNIKNGKRRTHV